MSDESDPNGGAVSRRQAISALAVAGTAANAAAQNSSAGAERIPQRTVDFSEGVSILDFGADPSGRNDSSPAFRKALEQLAGGRLHVPRGRYLVERIGGLGAAGQQIVGESRWNTIFATEAGGGPVFASDVAGKGTSAFHLLSDFMVDLQGQDVIGVDLASINCTTVQRLHIKGGSAARRRGIGLRFAAPLERGAYDNSAYDCSFEYLDRAIVWDSGANNNTVVNCRVINCRVGFDAAPPRPVDTPRVFGGRAEGCDVGLLEGAESGAYLAVRFEDNAKADIRFTGRSRNAAVHGGLTATSRLVLMDLDAAISPSIDSADLGFVAIEESAAQPKISTGRHVFGKAGKAPAINPSRDYAAQFADDIVFDNQAAVEFSTADGDGSLVGMLATAADELSIPAYNRQSGRYATVVLGGGPAIRPPLEGITDLGSPESGYKSAYLSGGLHIQGKQIVSKRQPAIADDPGGSVTASRVNQILAVLRRHGLIED